ncbi:MAG: hypothetical protein ACI4QE_04220 [Acutalibacteraceae bacterium]
MDNSKDKKIISKTTKRNLLLAINIVIMVALIVIATYAWFSRNLIDIINPDTVSMESSTNLEIRLSESDDWGYEKTFEFPETAVQREITGSGLPSEFSYAATAENEDGLYYVPVTGDSSGWKTTKSDSNPVRKDYDFILQPIYFRSTKPMTVYLGSNSQVLGAAEIDGKKLASANASEVGNESSYSVDSEGDKNGVHYSKDCVVGASRIAFVSADEATKYLTWLPRPDICYEQYVSEDVVLDYIHISEDGTAITEGYHNPFGVTPSKHFFYTVANNTAGGAVTSNTYESGVTSKYLVGDISTTGSSNNANEKIIEMTTQDEDGFYYANVNLVCWVEGCDQEARRAFANGSFGVGLEFIGFEKTS